MDRKYKHRTTRALARLFPDFVFVRGSLPNATTERIEGRRVEYILSRHDTPPVVFENGLMATFKEWRRVLRDLSRDTTTFAYNRPGYGRSERVATPRDGIHVVDELRALLRAKGLLPPYVLVGHSLGGLYMQLFARRYPEEVCGLVLVDSTHPEQFKGKGAPDAWPALLRVGFSIVTSKTEKSEFNACSATGESVLALPAPKGMPVIVLSASKPLKEKSELADDSNEKRRDIARLHPGSKQVWIDSGHHIHRKSPESIVAAIREVMRADSTEDCQTTD